MGFNDVLKKAFPFISVAASLGGPLGTMAAAAVGKAIGADKAPTADSLNDIIASALGDPAQRAAMVQAEREFQLQMAELGYKNAQELEATAAADRASARNREIQVRDSTPRYGFYLITFGFFGTLLFVVIHGVPDSSRDLINIMVGSLGTAWIGCVSYFFGSSSGSAAKTEIMAANSNGNK